jgi:hypothetical protein
MLSIARCLAALAVVPLLACADELPTAENGAAVTASVTCVLSEEVALTPACTEATVPLTTATRDGAVPPVIEAGVSYGLHLRPEGTSYAGVIQFVAPFSGDYVLYLGTPNVPLAITSAGEDDPSEQVEHECSSLLVAASCPLMRRAIGFSLEAGVAYRIELGPIAPQRWIRLRIESWQRPIVVAGALDGQASSDLYTIAPDGSERTFLLGGSGDEHLPRWSPDGSRVAYVIDRMLRVASADRSSNYLVAPAVGRDIAVDGSYPTVNAAAWSPDGQRLLYTYPRPPWIIDEDGHLLDESYETTLHIVDVDGTGDVPYNEPLPAQYPPGSGTLFHPAWSSQGLIAFRNDDDCSDCAGGGELETTLEDGSMYRRFQVDVVDPPWSGMGEIHAMDFSPDGGSVVFEQGGRWGQVPHVTRAEIVPSSDPAVLTLVTHDLGVFGRNPVWSPSGREVAYLGAGGVYVIDAFTPGAAPRQILVSSEVRSLDW